MRPRAAAGQLSVIAALGWASRLPGPGPGPGQPEHVLMAAAEKQEGSRSSYSLCQVLCASALPLSCDRSSHVATPRSVREPQSMWVQGGRTWGPEGSPAATDLCLGLFLRVMSTLCPIAWGPQSIQQDTCYLCPLLSPGGARVVNIPICPSLCSKRTYLWGKLLKLEFLGQTVQVHQSFGTCC